jgi:hypothetical protein
MSGALKYDDGKPPLSWIPREALVSLAKVMAYGADKYGKDNFRKGMEWRRLADASLRHLTSWVDGEDNDQESGLSHLGHAMFGLAVLCLYQTKGIGLDDRHSSAPSATFTVGIDLGVKMVEKPVGSRWRTPGGDCYEVLSVERNERQLRFDDGSRGFFVLSALKQDVPA